MTKILLVEDDNNLREIYGARLEAEGYDIAYAQDGEEALSVAVKEKPDLIVSDVMMPKISGFDMLDILRNTPETAETKVIMMTALSQLEDKERADKLGADKYLVKSQVTLEDVVKTVGEVLGAADPAMEMPAGATINSPQPVAEQVQSFEPTPAPTTGSTPESVEQSPIIEAQPSQDEVIAMPTPQNQEIVSPTVTPQPMVAVQNVSAPLDASQPYQALQALQTPQLPTAGVFNTEQAQTIDQTIQQNIITPQPELTAPAAPAAPTSTPAPQEIFSSTTQPVQTVAVAVAVASEDNTTNGTSVAAASSPYSAADPGQSTSDASTLFTPPSVDDSTNAVPSPVFNAPAQQSTQQFMSAPVATTVSTYHEPVQTPVSTPIQQGQVALDSDQPSAPAVAVPTAESYTVTLPETPELKPVSETSNAVPSTLTGITTEQPTQSPSNNEQSSPAEQQALTPIIETPLQSPIDASTYGPNLADILKEAAEEIKKEVAATEGINVPTMTAPSVANGGIITGAPLTEDTSSEQEQVVTPLLPPEQPEPQAQPQEQQKEAVLAAPTPPIIPLPDLYHAEPAPATQLPPTSDNNYPPQIVTPTTQPIQPPEPTIIEPPKTGGIYEENGKKIINPINDIASRPDLNALLAKEQASADLQTPAVSALVQPQTNISSTTPITQSNQPPVQVIEQTVAPTPPPNNIDSIAL